MTIETPDELRGPVDEAAIRDLAPRYCWAIDRLDHDALNQMFFWARVHVVLSPLTVSQHIVGSHLVEVDGDAQHVWHGCDGGDQFIVAGIYDDRLERSPAGWRIRHRDLHVLWTSGNPNVTQR